MESETLEEEIQTCTVCAPHLPLSPRPVFSFAAGNRIALIGQAPGRVVHQTGVPWDDQSGKRLRQWLGVDDETFYEPENFAILPMGFCFPGTGKSGDLPPRKECAPLWHERIRAEIPEIELFILIGAYAQKAYLGKRMKRNLTETVKAYQEYLPDFFPLVHPSPRNKIWQKKNPWFEAEVVPELKARVASMLLES